jgi:hypothetical protein
MLSDPGNAGRAFARTPRRPSLRGGRRVGAGELGGRRGTGSCPRSASGEQLEPGSDGDRHNPVRVVGYGRRCGLS